MMLTPITSKTLSPWPAAPAIDGLAALRWRAEPVLTRTAALLLLVLAATGVGLIVDPRTIGGAPAWLKPAKFAVSTALYSVTLAWTLSWLPEGSRLRRRVARVTAGVFLLEVALVCLQAARGTTSHFNTATPFDAAVFAVMGAGIVVQTVAAAAVTVALFRQRFADRAIGAALRAGMVITLAGASTGGLMTSPTAAQQQALRDTGRMPVSGSHTVGAPDGGPGLPGTGWSRAHGDLRVPHFVGLHAMQALPVVALVARRRRPDADAARLVRVAGTSYAGLFVVLLAQALLGESVAAPGPQTLALLAAWALTTLAGVWFATRAARTAVASQAVTA